MIVWTTYMDDLFSLKIRKNQEEAEQLQKRLVKARYETTRDVIVVVKPSYNITRG